LNVRGINDVMQTEMHTDKLLVPEPNSSEVEITTEKLKDKSLGTDQILAELILLRFTSLLILFGIRKNCHSSGMYHCTYLHKG
jgi:hypothetical protein